MSAKTRRFTASTLSPEQTLLLKAALFPADDALVCWQHWRESRGFRHLPKHTDNLLPALYDPIGMTSQRILPLVYRNLAESGDDLMPYLRGLYQFIWLRNQRTVQQLRLVLDKLNQRAIPVRTLNGLPLVLHDYADLGVRLLNAIDLLVPSDRMSDAMRVLRQTGFRAGRADQLFYRHLPAVRFTGPDHVVVDLHPHVLSQHTYAGADDPFWTTERQVQLPDGPAVSALSVTQQLFSNLVSGAAGGDPTGIQWVADSYVLYQQPDAQPDWHELLNMAERYRLTYPVRKGLGLLQMGFRLTLPPDVTERIGRMPVRPLEREYARLLVKNPAGRGPKLRHYLRKQRLEQQLFRPNQPVHSRVGRLVNDALYRLARLVFRP